jgi:hypothetical protein
MQYENKRYVCLIGNTTKGYKELSFSFLFLPAPLQKVIVMETIKVEGAILETKWKFYIEDGRAKNREGT